MAISKEVLKQLQENQVAAQRNQQLNEVLRFVSQEPFESSMQKKQEMLIDILQNRNIYKNALGNTLARTNYELGIPNTFGTSKYDKYATLYSDMQDPTNLRASQQSAGLKIVNGLFGAVTTAATTYMQPYADLASAFYAIVPSWRYEGQTWLDSFLDNPIQRALRQTEKVVSDIAPIYRYAEEQNSNLNLFQRMSYGGWWAEDFIKNMGFTVGAALGGKSVGLGTDWLFSKIASNTNKLVRNSANSKLFSETSKLIAQLASEGEDVSGLVSQLRNMDQSAKMAVIKKLRNQKVAKNFASTVVGMVTGAATEAHIEALQAREEMIESGLQHLNDYYNVNNPDAYFEYQAAMSKPGAMKMSFDQYCNMKKQVGKNALTANADKVMRKVFGFETLLLTATNAFAWRDWYNVSFSKFSNQLRDSGRFLTGSGKRFRGALTDIKERRNIPSAVGTFIKPVVSEGFEEMAQSGIVEGSRQYYGSKTNEFYKNQILALDPQYTQHQLSVGNAILRGLDHMLGTHDSWTEGFIGGVMGAIGLPGRTMSKAQRKAQNISIFNPKAWEMKGGLFEAYRKNKIDRDYAREFVTKVQNTFSGNTTPSQILRRYASLEAALMDQNDALLKGDKKKFFDSVRDQHRDLFEIYRVTNRLDELEEMYKNEISLTELSEGKPISEEQQQIIDVVRNFYKDSDITLSQTTSDEDLLKHLNKHAVEQLERLERYKDIIKNVNDLINLSGGSEKDDPITAQIFSALMFNIEDSNIRIKNLEDKYRDDLEKYLQSLNEIEDADVYFEKVAIANESGEEISRESIKQNLILQLTAKLVEKQIVNPANSNAIARDIIEYKELQLDRDENLELYARMLKDMSGEILKFKKLQKEHEENKNKADAKSYYDSIMSIFEDIKNKNVNEYSEEEILKQLQPALQYLKEYSYDDLFAKLKSYSESRTGIKFTNLKALFYFKQLTKFMDGKNNAVSELNGKIDQTIYDELMNTLPARIEARVEELLKTASDVDKNTLSNWVKRHEKSWWYDSKKAIKTLNIVNVQESSSSVSGEVRNFNQSGTVQTQPGTIKTGVVSKEDGIKKLKQLFEDLKTNSAFVGFPKLSFVENNDGTVEFILDDSDFNDESRYSQESIQKNILTQKAQTALYNDRLHIRFDPNNKKVIYQLEHEGNIDKEINLDYNNKHEAKKIANLLFGDLFYGVNNNLQTGRSKLQFVLPDSSSVNQFVFYFHTGSIWTGSEFEKPSSSLENQRINWNQSVNDILEALMSNSYSAQTNSQQSTTPQFVQHINGFLYEQSDIDRLNDYNNILQKQGVMPLMEKLRTRGFTGSSIASLQDWASHHGYRIIEDEGNIVGFDFIDTNNDYTINELTCSKRIFKVEDNIVCDNNSYKVIEVNAGGQIIEADGSSTTLNASINGTSYKLFIQNKAQGVVNTQKGQNNSLKSSTPLCEFDLWVESGGEKKQNNKNIVIKSQFDKFPTFSKWLRNQLKDAWNNIHSGNINIGDKVFFVIEEMSDIAETESNEIQKAYSSMKLKHPLGKNKIIACYVQSGQDTLFVGYLNPIGGNSKNTLIKEIDSESLNGDRYTYTTIVEDIDSQYENVIFDREDKLSSEVLEKEFDDCIWLVKKNGKFYSNADDTTLNRLFFMRHKKRTDESTKNEDLIEDGQLYLIPRHTNKTNNAFPIDLTYRFDQSTSTKEKLQNLLTNELDIEQVLKEVLETGEVMNLKRILNDLFYIQDSSNTIFINSEKGDGITSITIDVKDVSEKVINDPNSPTNEKMSYSYDITNDNIGDVVIKLIDRFINIGSLRISTKIVENANSQKDESGITLYNLIKYGLITTSAIHTRTSNAQLVLRSNAVDNYTKQVSDKKTTPVPDAAVNRDGEKYNIGSGVIVDAIHELEKTISELTKTLQEVQKTNGQDEKVKEIETQISNAKQQLEELKNESTENIAQISEEELNPTTETKAKEQEVKQIVIEQFKSAIDNSETLTDDDISSMLDAGSDSIKKQYPRASSELIDELVDWWQNPEDYEADQLLKDICNGKK